MTRATGTTSQYVIQHLVEKGIKVRAMVRTIDERSKQLETLGVEIVKGDFLDITSRSDLSLISVLFEVIFKLIIHNVMIY